MSWHEGEFGHRQLDQYSINFVYHVTIVSQQPTDANLEFSSTLAGKKNMQEALIKKLAKLKSYLNENDVQQLL